MKKIEEYTKIQSVFYRNRKTHKFDEAKFSLPAFEYLHDTAWVGTEKVDGTNIRILPNWEDRIVEVRGRTGNSSIPQTLFSFIQKILPFSLFESIFEEGDEIILFGEGYGKDIGTCKKYNSKGVNFVLFDVCINGRWLELNNVEDVARKLDIGAAPVVFEGTLLEAVELVRSKTLKSTWGDFLSEGLVLRPKVPLCNRDGSRVITKIKHRDF